MIGDSLSSTPLPGKGEHKSEKKETGRQKDVSDVFEKSKPSTENTEPSSPDTSKKINKKLEATSFGVSKIKGIAKKNKGEKEVPEGEKEYEGSQKKSKKHKSPEGPTPIVYNKKNVFSSIGHSSPDQPSGYTSMAPLFEGGKRSKKGKEKEEPLKEESKPEPYGGLAAFFESDKKPKKPKKERLSELTYKRNEALEAPTQKRKAKSKTSPTPIGYNTKETQSLTQMKKEIKSNPGEEKKGKLDSFDIPADQYIRERRQPDNTTRGTRETLFDSNTGDFIVRGRKKLGEGQDRIVSDAKVVSPESGKVTSGVVMGIAKEKDTERSKKTREREMLAKEKIEETFKENRSEINEYIVLPYKNKIDPKTGKSVSVAKKAGNKLDESLLRLSLQDKLGASVRIVRAIELCHIANVLHQDIKPDNILLLVDPKTKEPLRDEQGRLKFAIADFGNAYVRDSENFTTKDFVSGYCDPKINTQEGLREAIAQNWPLELDNYMLAITLLNIFTGQPMGQFLLKQYTEAGIDFKNKEDPDEKLTIWKSAPENWGAWGQLKDKLKLNYNEKVSAELTQLLKRLVDPDPRNRPSLQETRETLDALYLELAKDNEK